MSPGSWGGAAQQLQRRRARQRALPATGCGLQHTWRPAAGAAVMLGGCAHAGAEHACLPIGCWPVHKLQGIQHTQQHPRLRQLQRCPRSSGSGSHGRGWGGQACSGQQRQQRDDQGSEWGSCRCWSGHSRRWRPAAAPGRWCSCRRRRHVGAAAPSGEPRQQAGLPTTSCVRPAACTMRLVLGVVCSPGNARRAACPCRRPCSGRAPPPWMTLRPPSQLPGTFPPAQRRPVPAPAGQCWSPWMPAALTWGCGRTWRMAQRGRRLHPPPPAPRQQPLSVPRQRERGRRGRAAQLAARVSGTRTAPRTAGTP
jgi:hypothetical protein